MYQSNYQLWIKQFVLSRLLQFHKILALWGSELYFVTMLGHGKVAHAS